MIRRMMLAAGLVALTQLGGCWFVFIPGSLIQRVSDGLTGAEGEHCVSRAVKVGDRISLPDGKAGEVKSLSGTSVRCTDPNLPIRAAIAI